MKFSCSNHGELDNLDVRYAEPVHGLRVYSVVSAEEGVIETDLVGTEVVSNGGGEYFCCAICGSKLDWPEGEYEVHREN